MIAIPNMDKPKACIDCSVNDLVKGGTLYVVVEGEYALLIRLKGV